MIGPLTGIEISALGERRGRRIQVTIAATGKTIWLPANEIEIWPRRVILPVWLRDKFMRYLKTEKKGISEHGPQ